MIIPFETSLLQSAKVLRSNQTPAEMHFWKAVRGRQVSGYRFLRQRPILSYIVDFYCYELKLIIEIDGSIHEQTAEADLIRTKDLESLGMNVIRYKNEEIIHRLPSVIERLKIEITNLSKLPSLKLRLRSEKGKGRG